MASNDVTPNLATGNIASGTDPALSNSLTDLAARIRAEHEAVNGHMQQSLEHAIATGQLLLEAKRQVGKHGRWLPWLDEHCRIPQRTAQHYMRLARNADEINANFADLTVGEAVRLLADAHHRVVTQLERAAKRASYTLETPSALLPLPTRRKIRTARNKQQRQWMLVIGPDISREAVKQREQAARETESVQRLQQQHDDLIAQAAELEAEANEVRERAKAASKAVSDHVNDLIGAVHPFTETFDFQVSDAKADAALAKLKPPQLIERLMAARNGSDDALTGINHGIWGDMNLMGRTTISPCGGGTGWTKFGSPDWLKELFPDIEETADAAPGAP